MRRFARSCGLAAALVVLARAPVALCLANRVFVSARSGNDANACDNINTPCKTFAGAVLQLNPGGEAIVLDSGGYGPVTITQSLTIAAPPGVLAFIHPPAADAIRINAPGATVVLRGLTLNGDDESYDGIRWEGSSGRLHIERCVIEGFPRGVSAFTDGASELFVRDTTVRNSAGDAVIAWAELATLRVSIDHCHIENSQNNGIYLVADAAAFVDAAIRDSLLSFNDTGLNVTANQGGVARALVDRCSVSGNGDGMEVWNGGSALRVMRSSVTHNGSGFAQGASATLETIGNNMVRGNATDEYNDGSASVTVLPGD